MKILSRNLVLILALHGCFQSTAQDYVIDRGNFSGFYTGSLRMCVVDKNEYYAPYTASSKVVIRRYKNGSITDWGTTTGFPDAGGAGDIARNPLDSVIYISFFNSTYDKIYTYKRGPLDNDWQLVTMLDKPGSYNMGYTVRLSFNENSQTLFMAFTEQTSSKVYLYELVSGTWADRAGASSMSCSSNRMDLVSYGNKVIVSTSPAGNLRVHVFDVVGKTLTNLNQNVNNVAGFVTTAYDAGTDTYVSFYGQSSPWMNVKVARSVGGADWTDMTGTLTGAMDNGSWGGYIVYNQVTSRFTLIFSTGFIKGYTWTGADWAAITIPYMASTNTFAIANYKDVYFLAWNSNTPVGIYTVNETPTRNTVDISTTPTTTTCAVNFQHRGVGNKVVVFVKKSPTYDAPVLSNNTTYTANTVYRSGAQLGSSGWYCVYNGVGETVNITGLDPTETYQLQAIEYNGAAAAEMYSPMTAVSGNPVSFVSAVSLPVHWLSFTGKELNAAMQLNWSTASEINSSHFIVERSANGISFETIGTVLAASGQSETHQYTYTDFSPLKTVSYYRLNQIDKDGKSVYSTVIKFSGVSNSDVKIWSDTESGFIRVYVPVSNLSVTGVEIYDLNGRRLIQKQLQPGLNDINVSALSKGIYVVKAYSKNGLLKSESVLR